MDKKRTDSDKNNEARLSIADKYPVSYSVFTLARSHRVLAAQMLRKVGLFTGQEMMLMQLWNRDGQSQNSLRRTLCLDHSTVAKSVRRLEEAGLVSRQCSKEDGRVNIVSLTQAGRDMETKVLGYWSDLEKITTEGLNEEEKALLVDLSRRIGSRLDDLLDCSQDK